MKNTENMEKIFMAFTEKGFNLRKIGTESFAADIDTWKGYRHYFFKFKDDHVWLVHKDTVTTHTYDKMIQKIKRMRVA